MLRVTLDGTVHRVPPGTTILAALGQAGVDVPHLCHDDRLAPTGGCRMCVVDVEGEGRPVASCAAAVREGMIVRTRTPELEALRRTHLELIAGHYPAEAVAGEPEHPFHRLLARYGVQASGTSAVDAFRDDGHPYLGVAMDRCIHCERCVRICDEVQGQFVWGVWQRGEKTHIAPRRGRTLVEAGCVACGACADSCPTGALFDKRSPATAERWTRTTCVYCGVGCQMEVGTAAGRVVRIRPADSPVNRGHLCVKGRYAYEFVHAPDRITVPMIREDHEGRWRRASWDEALDFAAAGLRSIRERYGPDAIGVLGSARAANEDNYLVQKFARVVLGTNNVDCCARVCHTPSAKALKDMLGAGAATNSFDDIERAATFLLCGCNPTENHPVVGARIRQAALGGARLIVVDPRRTELAVQSDIHLPVRPGHNVPLFHAMAAVILEEGLAAGDFLRDRVDGLDEFAAHVRAFSPEAVAEGCGVRAVDIRAAARLYATARPAMCFHGLGVTEHLQGTEGVMCLVNLALLTGNVGVPGAGINPLRGQNNVQGAAQMGCDPVTLTGGQSIAAAGSMFASAWGAPIPPGRGLNLLEMMDAAAAGRLEALWAFGYDVLLSLADANRTAQALDRVGLVIVQDLFLNETAKACGTVFFPAASFLERDGTFMNSDRRVQRIRKALDPPGDCRPDWWIIQQLAQRMGVARGFDFEGPESVWDEVRRLWPAGAGLSYRRLEGESLHWPCPDETHPGTPVLHAGRFLNGGRARLQAVPHVPSPEQSDAEFPMLLVTGRVLYHFNAGTMTYRTSNAELQREDTLDMSPVDARHLGLRGGERVRVTSRYGAAVLPVRITPAVRPGELFASFHRPELFVNRVTLHVRDRQVGTPEYKVTAVRVQRWPVARVARGQVLTSS